MRHRGGAHWTPPRSDVVERLRVAQITFWTSSPTPSATRPPIEAAVSTTAPAARFTRATAEVPPLLPPSELPPPLLDELLLFEADAPRFADDLRPPPDARLALDFFAEDFFALARLALDFFAPPREAEDDFLADDFLAVERFALDFFADDFFAVERLALDFFAEARFADDFLAEDFFADDLRPDDFFADDLRPEDFFADAAAFRVVRRAVPLLRVDVLPDLDRVAMKCSVVGGGAPRVCKN
jgi:hypothetical protein